MKRRVVVTGLGAVTPIGNTVPEFWQGIREGRVGIGEITRFDTESFKVKLAARNNVYLNYKNMPAPQLLVNSLPIAAGIAGKYCFFKKLGFEKDYVDGVLEGIRTVKKTRKVPYRKEDLRNYLAIEWELIYGAALYIYEFSRRQIRKKLASATKS